MDWRQIAWKYGVQVFVLLVALFVSFLIFAILQSVSSGGSHDYSKILWNARYLVVSCSLSSLIVVIFMVPILQWVLGDSSSILTCVRDRVSDIKAVRDGLQSAQQQASQVAASVEQLQTELNKLEGTSISLRKTLDSQHIVESLGSALQSKMSDACTAIGAEMVKSVSKCQAEVNAEGLRFVMRKLPFSEEFEDFDDEMKARYFDAITTGR